MSFQALEKEPSKSSKHWKTERLGNMLTVLRGVTYKKEHASKESKSGLIPILRANNIQNGLVFEDLVYVPEKCVSETQLLRAGDIVIAASSGSRHIVGKAAQLTTDWQGSFGTFCFGLRPKLGVHPGYLAWFLQTSEYRHQVSELSAGVNINNLRATHIEEIPIPIAPLPEQRRIVAEIEKQFTRLEAGVSALKRVQANLKRYRAAVLKAACSGQLVPTETSLARDRGQKSADGGQKGFETGEELLARILDERRKNWIESNRQSKIKNRQYREPSAPDTANLPPLPDGWTWASVEQLTGLVATGATPLRGKSDFWQSGTIPWVTSGALNNNFITEAFEFITPLAIQKTNAKIFPAGTLLVALYGEGKTRGKVSELRIEAATNQACAALLFDPTSSAFRAYLKVFLQNNYEAIRLLASGGVQPNLSLSIMKGTIVPLPPLAEQTRIVAEVERRLSVVEELEAVVTANLQRAGRLRQSILQKAFSGGM